MKQFEIGKTYYARSINDNDCIFRFRVIARTAKTITLQDKDGTTIGRRKISIDDNGEYIKPLGNYSMAPTLRAINEYEGRE